MTNYKKMYRQDNAPYRFATSARCRLSLLLMAFCGLSSQSVLAEPTVNGSTISWPDDGWYQVQTADGETTLCNGGTYCDVEPGTYLVINHTTSKRFTGIEVHGEGTDQETSSTITRENHAELLKQIFHVYQGTIYGSQRLPAPPEDFRSSHVASPVDVSNLQQVDGDYWGSSNFRGFEKLRYQCDNDGLLDYLATSLDIAFRQTYTWENCLDDGTTSNGILHSTNHIDGRHLISSEYKADYADGNRLEISGNYGSTFRKGSIYPYDYTQSYWRTNRFSYSFHSETEVVNIRYANTEAKHFFTLHGNTTADFTAMLRGSFQLNSSLTGYDNIDVNTIQAFEAEVQGYALRSAPRGYYPSSWNYQSGALELTAEDGSALKLEVISDDGSQVRITLLQDGLELETLEQSFDYWRASVNSIARDPRDYQ